MAANEEASPICRGKNLSWETVMLFFNYMPKEPMPKDKFNSYVEENINSWTQTHSQIARQLAFYYEEDGVCYPRFNEASTLEDLFSYMIHWAHNYFVPNPFAPSLKGKTPTCIYSHLVKCIENGMTDFDEALDSLFDVPLSSHDKVRVYLQNYSNIKFDQGIISLNENIVDNSIILDPTEDAATSPKLYFLFFGKEDSHESVKEKKISDKRTLQQIYYGAPGTGKSYKINEITKSTKNFTRTTFHPDSDYSTFVGCYKPTMEPTGTIVGGKEQTKISYSYVAQAFLQAYTAAWKNTSEPYYLIIEEINRGNCAQIFGDLFQLLDRDENGMSSYGITPDKDIANYLRKEFAKSEIENADIKNGNTMMLPSNLYILATMNTSDQSLFPIDSAFKRRWDWEYVPIEDAGKKHYIKVGNKKYDWWTFIDTINNSIDHITGSEDKKMGYWFVKPQNNDCEITAKQFVGKVLFYLWNDVYKDYFDMSQCIFKIKKDDGTIEKKPFTFFFGSDADNRIIAFMDANGITGINLNNDEQVPEGLKQLDGNSSSDSSELQEWRKQYWAEIKELMGIKGLDFRTTPTTRNYYQMSIGITGISLINSINRNSGECWSGIYIEKQQADEYYPKFKSVKDELDRQIPNLEWIHEDGKYASIRISKSFANILNSEIREESKAWFAETSVQFNNVFKPIVEQIFK